MGSRKTGLSPPVIFTDRSKAVVLLWFIFVCYHIYNVCLLHDFVATLKTFRIALCIVFYFVQASTVTVRNHNRSTALERSVLKYWGLKPAQKNVGRADFSYQFKTIIVRYKRIGYNINIMRQSACLMFNPITVNNFASLFNCTPVGRASDSMMAPT